MSGFFGFFNRSGKPAEQGIAETMLDAISYWEPDERHFEMRGPVALGHAMLWNSPESKHEHLPLQKDGLILTMDARIDNRDELAGQLDLPDRPPEQIGDSEFILAAYRKWGESCPKHLLGDFAFAIWDEKKEQLFCARDHIGIKPFFYYVKDDLFVFTNLLKAVVGHPEVPKKPDEASLAKYLRVEGFHDDKATFIKNVKKLPPASTLVVSGKTIRESGYWNIDEIQPVCYKSSEVYLKHFRKLLENAVEDRLRTYYPVASHLSGGLDSSSVAVLAARKLGKASKTLYAFNWAQKPDDMLHAEHDEWDFAERIARTESIRYESLSLSGEYLSKLYDTIDLFSNDIGYFWEEYLVRDAATLQNVRTLISGWGGDQFASYDGYACYSGLFWRGHFIKAVRRIYNEYAQRKHPLIRTLRRSVREVIYPLFYKQMNGYYKKYKFDIDPFLYCHERFAHFARKVRVKEATFVPGAHGEQKYLLKEGSIQKRLEHWHAAATLKKIEYVYPLLDKRIVEFSLAMPEEFFCAKNGVSRSFFREAVKDLLEPDILWAQKGNNSNTNRRKIQVFESSFRLWFEKNRVRNAEDSDYIRFDRIISRLEKYFNEAATNKPNLSTLIESIILFHAKLK